MDAEKVHKGPQVVPQWCLDDLLWLAEKLKDLEKALEFFIRKDFGAFLFLAQFMLLEQITPGVLEKVFTNEIMPKLLEPVSTSFCVRHSSFWVITRA